MISHINQARLSNNREDSRLAGLMMRMTFAPEVCVFRAILPAFSLKQPSRVPDRQAWIFKRELVGADQPTSILIGGHF